MESTSQHQTEPQELVIPSWDIGPSRPPGTERRRDRGAADRHVQALTGVAPAEAVQRRRAARPQRPERVIKLWLEADEGLRGQPAALRAAQLPAPADAADPRWADNASSRRAASQETTISEELARSCDGDTPQLDASSEGRPHRSIEACRGLLAAAAAWVGVVVEAW